MASPSPGAAAVPTAGAADGSGGVQQPAAEPGAEPAAEPGAEGVAAAAPAEKKSVEGMQ